MNRLWIGIALMVLLLAMGVGLLWGSVAFFGSISHEMELSCEAALADNWAQACQTVKNCRSKWDQYCRFWSAFTDHAPIEQVQTLFTQLEIYEAQQLKVEFATCCQALAREAEAIEESHGLAWWSVL